MADSKISALPASTTPLAGTEVLPIVQSSTTKQVTVANLTAGRAVATGALTVTGDATLSTGNLIPSTAAKGINFTANTPAAGMTSQLLNWYEEGTWTPTDGSGAGRAFSNRRTVYTRIGRQVTATAFFIVDISANASSFTIAGLPYSTVALGFSTGSFSSSGGNAGVAYISSSSNTIQIALPTTYNTNLTNAQVSNAGVAITIVYQI